MHPDGMLHGGVCRGGCERRRSLLRGSVGCELAVNPRGRERRGSGQAATILRRRIDGLFRQRALIVADDVLDALILPELDTELNADGRAVSRAKLGPEPRPRARAVASADIKSGTGTDVEPGTGTHRSTDIKPGTGTDVEPGIGTHRHTIAKADRSADSRAHSHAWLALEESDVRSAELGAVARASSHAFSCSRALSDLGTNPCADGASIPSSEYGSDGISKQRPSSRSERRADVISLL